MAHYEDLLAKLILEVTLEDDGLVETERQIPVLDAQGADLYFEPAPGPRNPAGCYALVNRMTAGPTVLEPFSRAPAREWVARGCLRKQFQLYHNRCLEAERKERPLPEMQWMWIVSPGRPDGVLAAYGFRDLDGFPTGVYTLAEGFSVGLVVLSELPRSRETILLRLLGPTEMRQQALREVQELALDDADRGPLLSTITRARFMIERDPKLPQEQKEELMTAMRAEFEQFKKGLIDKGIEKGVEQGLEQGLEKGLEKGKEQGKAEAVVEVLEARGVPLNEGIRARILSCADLPTLRQWLTRALQVQSADELFAVG